MRKFSVLSVAAALLFSASALANEGATEPVAPKTKVCAKIHNMLKDNTLLLNEDEEISTVVRFTVNSENEIVVLSVLTDDLAIESFIKNKLNYQNISNTGLKNGGIYEVPIRFTS